MLRKLFALAVFIAACGAATFADAAAAVRVEWIKNGYVYSTETLTSSGVSAQSGAMPDMGGLGGQVRITPLAGAMVVTHGLNPTATQTNGQRIQAGQAPILLNVNAGDQVAAIEASDDPAQVTGSFSATGQSASFIPRAGQPFNVSGRGTFVGTVQLERSFDGTNWHPITAAGTQLYVWTAPFSEIDVEPQYGVLYRLNDTAYTSGTVTYRISQ